MNKHLEELETIFIPFNTASSKNSRIFNAKLKRSFESKAMQKYRKSATQYYQDYQPRFKELAADKSKPLFIGLHFVRDSRRRWDFHNICQSTLDLMTQYGWIDDDDSKNIFPIPFPINDEWEGLDKENPGVYITILNGHSVNF